jgi:hypothetical protein
MIAVAALGAIWMGRMVSQSNGSFCDEGLESLKNAAENQRDPNQ